MGDLLGFRSFRGRRNPMQYALLGNTGLAVSRLAFGTMTFTQGNKNIAAVYKVGAKLADELVGQASMPASICSIRRTAMPAANPRRCLVSLSSSAATSGDYHQSRLSLRTADDPVRPFPAPHPVVDRSKPAAPAPSGSTSTSRTAKIRSRRSRRRWKPSTLWCALARCAISAFPTGRPGRPLRRWK